jgi:hypothetical protein
MNYKIPKLQIQKRLNKGDMTKNSNLTQNFQKFITMIKKFIFIWKFENKNAL